MADRLEAVFSASRNLYPYLPAAYMSLIEHNPGCRVWLFIEDDDLPYGTPRCVETVNVSKQTYFSPQNCANWKTGYTYLSLMRSVYPKLFCGEDTGHGVRKLPKIDKILQLDVDVIVMENLAPIWNLDMSNTYFGATQEYNSTYKPFGPKYWNLGVGLLGLEAMRRDGVDDIYYYYVRRIESPWVDQDCLCRIGAENPDKVYDFGVRYNDGMCCGQTMRPAIVHYVAIPDRYTDPEMYRAIYYNRYRHYNEEVYDDCRKAGIKC